MSAHWFSVFLVRTDEGEIVTTDNFFTSVDLANQLKKGTLVGTMKQNNTEISQEFKSARPCNEKSCIFGFTKDLKDLTLVSLAPKKKKSVVLLSSLHHNSAIAAI
jgi:hypothetical protein